LRLHHLGRPSISKLQPAPLDGRASIMSPFLNERERAPPM